MALVIVLHDSTRHIPTGHEWKQSLFRVRWVVQEVSGVFAGSSSEHTAIPRQPASDLESETAILDGLLPNTQSESEAQMHVAKDLSQWGPGTKF